ncbi:MAG: glycosyltransferase family 4 protein [Candidatus Promineifilaceae bacterium]
MRIALLIYGSIDTVSGGYLYNRQLVDYLRRQGDSVEIISIPYRGYWHHLRDNFSQTLRKRLDALNIDVLIQDEMNHPSLVWLNGRLKRDYQVVSLVHLLKVTERLPRWLRPIYRQIEQHYLRSVDGFIVTSQTTDNDIQRRFGLHKPTVVAVPAGDRFSHRTTPTNHVLNGSLRILYVGNVIRRKGLHLVLEAMATVANTTLTIVGPTTVEPDYTQSLRTIIGRNHLQSRVQFLGPLDGDALVTAYQQADLFAMPAYYESFGIVYLEAMGFGLPTIGTTQGAAHELITHGKNGYLIETDDVHALAKHLQTLCDHPKQRRQMRDHALARFAAHPSWEASMAKVRAYLVAKIFDQ